MPRRQDIQLTRLIHENMAVVMSFAFSHHALLDFFSHFQGEWKYLTKLAFDIPEATATRAILEIAVLLRLLDDAEKLTEYLRQTMPWHSLGTIHAPDGGSSELTVRDFANKVIHSAKLEWDFSAPKNPKLISHASPDEQQTHGWVKAEILIPDLAAFCGTLMN